MSQEVEVLNAFVRLIVARLVEAVPELSKVLIEEPKRSFKGKGVRA